MKTWIALVAGGVSALAGCMSASPTPTPTQQNELQTRVVEGSIDRTFAAATDALIDAGYTVTLTDGDGGLLTGVRREDPSAAENTTALVVSTLLTMGQAPALAAPHWYAVCVQVFPRDRGAASVRIRCYGLGDGEASRRETGQLWTLMQRHVLVSDPVASPAGSGPHEVHP